MGCGSACSDNFVLSILPTWNQNFFFRFRAGKFSSAAPSIGLPYSQIFITSIVLKTGVHYRYCNFFNYRTGNVIS